MKDAIDWQLGYCCGGKYKYRVMMPVRDLDGRIKAWQGRDITGRAKIPYLSTSEQETGTNIKHLVLNLYRAKEPYIIVEGYMDLMAVGKEHGICLLGKGMAEKQFELLMSRKPKCGVVLLDGDAGMDADGMVSNLRCIGDFRALSLPFGVDPASMSKEKIWGFLGENGVTI